eukprot:TRINITY_DN81_c1_g1_i2.p1 TRINITY_DN81_c1_g1~~TRINITY_DN81_c1_g1_i2.p1  ORF type:complete len:131 (+),score=4.93 TRINITY_DN81_c1_g1_i2:41-433(+)
MFLSQTLLILLGGISHPQSFLAKWEENRRRPGSEPRASASRKRAKSVMEDTLPTASKIAYKKEWERFCTYHAPSALPLRHSPLQQCTETRLTKTSTLIRRIDHTKPSTVFSKDSRIAPLQAGSSEATLST